MEKRKRSRREPYKAVCPACGNIIPVTVKDDWKKIKVSCPRCTTRFTLSRSDETPQIQKDFEAGDDYYGQGE